MRTVPALALVVLVALAGCNLPAGIGGTDPGTDDGEGTALPDPETDRVGWENGYWHNETLSVSNADGLAADEREAVISRAMARVEYVRDAEFEATVPVDIISRAEFRERDSTNYSAAFRTFDNAKFEALMLIGEDTDSLAVQQGNSGSNVLGFYAPANDSIKIVAESDNPSLDGEGTLAHELVHALQDQRHNLSSLRGDTRDGVNGRNGLIEGEANAVQDRYTARCGGEWSCIEGSEDSQSGVGDDFHWGVYYLNFFPYSDGPGFVEYQLRQGGWDAVDAAFEDPPESAEQVIYPARYTDRDPPADVPLTDTATGEWERVRPDRDRPEYAVFGQSALTSMFAYTLHDEDRQPVVDPRSFVNVEDGSVNTSDPYDYALDVTSGWEGDRLHVYQRDAETNETAYVWRIEWDSPDEAREFVRGYRALLRYWGAESAGGQADTYRISDSNDFGDAFRVDRSGATVTITNAPTVGDLSAVRPEA